MNVFEDLVVELKEENLLEDTFIERQSLKQTFAKLEPQFEVPIRTNVGKEFGAKTPNSVSKPVGRPPLFAPSQDAVRFHKRCTELVAVFQVVQHVLATVENQEQKSKGSNYDDLLINKTLHQLSQALIDPSTLEFAEAKSTAMAELYAWQRNLAARDSEIPIAMLRKYCDTCQPPLSSHALFTLARFYYELPT